MSNNSKITGIRLNGWGILVLALIVFFFWEPLLIIGVSLAAGWLISRNWTKILSLWNKITGKN